MVVLATLLRNNETKTLGNVLHKITYKKKEIREIKFLVSLLKLNDNTAPILKKAQALTKMDDNGMRKFAQYNDIDKNLIERFIEYNLSVDGDEMIAKGLKGPAIGQAVLEKEIDNFKQIS